MPGDAWDVNELGLTPLAQMPLSERRAALLGLIPHLDLTTLEGDDTTQRVQALCERALSPGAGLPSCAAVCVYPALVKVAAECCRGTGLGVASVCGGFPAGQTPLAVKVLEAELAVQDGATELDLVINRGQFLSGNYAAVTAEVAAVRAACGGVQLKVILETGELPGAAAWKLAAELALNAGADMVKTSTGKAKSGASLAAARVLCEAAQHAGTQSGVLRGFKPAGGIRTPDEARAYREIVSRVLGPEAATCPRRFRIGASSLLDAIIAALRTEI